MCNQESSTTCFATQLHMACAAPTHTATIRAALTHINGQVYLPLALWLLLLLLLLLWLSLIFVVFIVCCGEVVTHASHGLGSYVHLRHVASKQAREYLCVTLHVQCRHTQQPTKAVSASTAGTMPQAVTGRSASAAAAIVLVYSIQRLACVAAIPAVLSWLPPHTAPSLPLWQPQAQ
jgi:hypothetical protein